MKLLFFDLLHPVLPLDLLFWGHRFLVHPSVSVSPTLLCGLCSALELPLLSISPYRTVLKSVTELFVGVLVFTYHKRI